MGYSIQMEEHEHTGKRDPWRAMNMRHWSIYAVRRGLESWDCSARMNLCGISAIYTNMWSKGAKSLGQTLFRFSGDWTRGKEHKLKHRRFSLNIRKMVFFLWGSPSTATCCSVRLWSLHSWRYLEVFWTWSWSASCVFPCLSRKIGSVWITERMK